jgi:predicted negative regulator of RcsB-dependent stress response
LGEQFTEQQQIEMLKKLWKEYGFSIISGVIMALVIGFGWRYYKSYTVHQAETASIIYERLVMDVLHQDVEDMKTQSHALLHQFKGTSYATLASLTLAKVAVEQNNLDEAVEHLQWVMRHSHHDDFREIARIRLARVYLAKQDTKKALELLNKVNNSAYMALVFDVKGDIYLKNGQTEEARKAYQKAFEQLPENAMIRPILRMKISDLSSP